MDRDTINSIIILATILSIGVTVGYFIITTDAEYRDSTNAVCKAHGYDSAVQLSEFDRSVKVTVAGIEFVKCLMKVIASYPNGTHLLQERISFFPMTKESE